MYQWLRSLEHGKTTPNTGTVICPKAEAPNLLNIMKRRNCGDTHRCEPVPPQMEVRDFELIFALSKLLTSVACPHPGCVYFLFWTRRGESTPLWPKIREFKPTSALSFKIGGLTYGVAAYKILGLVCIHCIFCPKYQKLYSGNNGLISQVLKQVTFLVILCVMLK